MGLQLMKGRGRVGEIKKPAKSEQKNIAKLSISEKRDERKMIRICRICGEKWHVSALAKPVKKYICPFCKFKRGEP